MRILISNVYSYKNKGDAAIVISLLNEIKRVFERPDIMIQTIDIKNDGDKYGAPITSSLMWILLSSVRDRNPLVRVFVPLRGLLALYTFLGLHKIFGKGPKWILGAQLREFVTEYEKSDLVIGCGGGYLRMPNSSLRETILLYVTCLNFLVAKSLGKPVYLYSQSIGPMRSPAQTWILKRALKKVDLIEPREDVSVRYLDSLNLDTPTVATADPALLLGGYGKFNPETADLKSGRLHVGITVRKWFNTHAELQAYEQAIASNIDYLIEKYDAQVFYIPQVIAENFGDDDRIIAREVKEFVKNKNKENFVIIDKDLKVEEIIGLCGQMEIFIGTRMHSNIFALISHVPVVAIEYEHKTRGIMRGLKLEELTIDIRDVTAESLQGRIELLMGNREHYKNLLVTNLPSQINESRRAIEVIKDRYAEKV
jgi:colanic acid/amylovoran biosynthesis protein